MSSLPIGMGGGRQPRKNFPKTARGGKSALERSDRATGYAWAQFYQEKSLLERETKALGLTRSLLLDKIRKEQRQPVRDLPTASGPINERLDRLISNVRARADAIDRRQDPLSLALRNLPQPPERA